MLVAVVWCRLLSCGRFEIVNVQVWYMVSVCFFFNDTAPTDIYTYGHPLSLHDALPISNPLRSSGDLMSPPPGSGRRTLDVRAQLSRLGTSLMPNLFVVVVETTSTGAASIVCEAVSRASFFASRRVRLALTGSETAATALCAEWLDKPHAPITMATTPMIAIRDLVGALPGREYDCGIIATLRREEAREG